MRDLTHDQFLAKLYRHGIKPGHYSAGYCQVLPGVDVYRFNGGETYRAQLAYLLKQQHRIKRIYYS